MDLQQRVLPQIHTAFPFQTGNPVTNCDAKIRKKSNLNKFLLTKRNCFKFATMKERVLIVTKFYYRRGGDCIYALNLEQMLRQQGHEVAVFAMDYPENNGSEWSAYWPSEISFSGGAGQKLAALKRTLGTGDVKTCFDRILKDFKPDIVHLNNIHSYISPVVGRMARQAVAKVVWTLHDYKLLCPAYSCLREGQPCELCFHSKWPVVRTKCMKGSMAASVIAFIEARHWNRRKLESVTDAFVCPSGFMAEKMASGGFNKNRLKTLCNFIAPEMAERYRKIDNTTPQERDYYCYVGRLSEEKGIATLLKAASELPYKFKVAGDGPLGDELRRKFGACSNIEFLGMLSSEDVKTLLYGARFSVMPSECYENNPLGVIESFCAGTPVVGASIGGIPELINQSRGMTFRSGDAADLAKAINKAWATDYDRAEIQRGALIEFSPEKYYQRLISEIYR